MIKISTFAAAGALALLLTSAASAESVYPKTPYAFDAQTERQVDPSVLSAPDATTVLRTGRSVATPNDRLYDGQ